MKNTQWYPKIKYAKGTRGIKGHGRKRALVKLAVLDITATVVFLLAIVLLLYLQGQDSNACYVNQLCL